MTDKEAQLELAQARETEEARAIFAALAADPIALPFISKKGREPERTWQLIEWSLCAMARTGLVAVEQSSV